MYCHMKVCGQFTFLRGTTTLRFAGRRLKRGSVVGIPALSYTVESLNFANFANVEKKAIYLLTTELENFSFWAIPHT